MSNSGMLSYGWQFGATLLYAADVLVKPALRFAKPSRIAVFSYTVYIYSYFVYLLASLTSHSHPR